MNLSSFEKGYIASIFLSFLIGFLFYNLFKDVSEIFGKFSLSLISLGLFITSIFLYKASRSESLKENLEFKDWIILGILQGISVLPGFSRSGLTIGYLCLRKYNAYLSVKVSLLLSFPVLLAASVYSLLSIEPSKIIIIQELIVFVVSLLSAKFLIEISRKLKPYIFTLLFAILVLLGTIFS